MWGEVCVHEGALNVFFSYSTLVLESTNVSEGSTWSLNYGYSIVEVFCNVLLPHKLKHCV